MEFCEQERVLVNPLRIKDWVVSELEASLLLYYTGQSRSSAAIIDEQARNVLEQNEQALHAMHQLKEEALRMKECLLRGDFKNLHEVLHRSWEAKKAMASRITNDHIDSIYSCAVEAGAHSAKISGAGGGGFMMLLTEPVSKDRVADALRALRNGGVVYNCHFTTVGAQAWRVE
jgi:D-glycero-alpha-D-manno-heptose-7-phosphate kinase